MFEICRHFHSNLVFESLYDKYWTVSLNFSISGGDDEKLFCVSLSYLQNKLECLFLAFQCIYKMFQQILDWTKGLNFNFYDANVVKHFPSVIDT